MRFSRLSARMDVSGEVYAKKHPGGRQIQPSATLGVRWRLKIRFVDEKISVFRSCIMVSTSYNGVDIDILTSYNGVDIV